MRFAYADPPYIGQAKKHYGSDTEVDHFELIRDMNEDFQDGWALSCSSPSLKFKMCENGAPCHLPAPRGSNKGTQGMASSKHRAMIPQQFCMDIVEACEQGGHRERWF